MMKQNLSKSAERLAPAWLENLYGKIISTKTDDGTLALMLEKYKNHNKGEGAMILAHAFNALTLKDPATKNEKKSILWLVTISASSSPSVEERRWFRTVIALLLDHGAICHVPGLFALGHIIDATPKNLSQWEPMEYTEIIRTFIEHSQILDHKLTNDLTLAHLVAQFPGQALELILQKKPELVNARSQGGGTPLMVAIQSRHEKMALRILRNFNPDLTLRNSKGQSILTAAIFYSLPQVIGELLERGACIEPQSSVGFMNHPEIMVILAQSGYFLKDRGIPEDVPIALKDFNKDRKQFFLLFSKDSFEYISTPEDLLQSKIMDISPSQAKRLHQSFRETLAYSPNNEKLSALYKAFSDKYPLDENITLTIDVQKPMKDSFSPYSFLAAMKSLYSEKYATPSLKSSLLILTRTLEHPRMQSLEKDELSKLIIGFTDIIIADLKENRVDPGSSFGISPLIKNISLKFMTNVVLRYAMLAKGDELDRHHQCLMASIMSATMAAIENNNKTSHKIVECLTSLLNEYKNKNVAYSNTNQITLLTHVHRLGFYAAGGFHKEIISGIRTMHEEAHTFNRNDIVTTSFVSLTIRICRDFLQSIEVVPEDLEDLCILLEKLLDFVKETTSKCKALKSNHLDVETLIFTKNKEIIREYHKLLNGISQNSHSIYVLDHMTDSKAEIVIPDLGKGEIDAALLRAKIKTIPNIFWTSNKYYLEFYGESSESILNTVKDLNALRKEDLHPTLKPETPMSVQQDYTAPPFVVSPEVIPKRQPIAKQKNPMPSQQTPCISPLVEANREAKLVQRIAQIRATLNLRDEVEIFNIQHPGMPESSRDNCFGLWGHITGEITPETLQLHQKLASTGKVVTRAYNQAGLKSTKVMVEGKAVEGLKTKRPKDDLRINSAAMKVALPNKDRILLYVFGAVTDHKDKTPTIDTRKILQASQNKR